jgi:hypothetical protein
MLPDHMTGWQSEHARAHYDRFMPANKRRHAVAVLGVLWEHLRHMLAHGAPDDKNFEIRPTKVLSNIRVGDVVVFSCLMKPLTGTFKPPAELKGKIVMLATVIEITDNVPEAYKNAQPQVRLVLGGRLKLERPVAFANKRTHTVGGFFMYEMNDELRTEIRNAVRGLGRVSAQHLAQEVVHAARAARASD